MAVRQDLIPWVQRKHNVFDGLVLTADDIRADAPPKFKGRLWAPQATLLKAMKDLEECQVLRLKAPNELIEAGHSEVDALFECRCARISAKISFGKTVLCVALICTSSTPQTSPIPLNIPVMDVCVSQNRLCVTNTSSARAYQFKEVGRGVFPRLNIKFKRQIDATLVVTGSAIITQWQDIIKQFAPHLKFFTVEDAHTLQKFQDIVRSSEINEYNLVLLKAGKVTSSFVVDGEPTPPTKQRNLTQALGAVTEGHIWSRMIVDDFDAIQLAEKDYFLPARFIWIISATIRTTNIQQGIIPAPTVEEFIRLNSLDPILSAASDVLFDNILKIDCEEKYVQAHINTTTVNYRRIVVKGGQAVGMLHDLGVDDAVVEMVAAGAVDTAAECLGIGVNSVGELVDRVLAENVENYRNVIQVLDRIRRAQEIASKSSLPHKREVSAIRHCIKTGNDTEANDALASIGYPDTPFLQAMKSLEEETEKDRQLYGNRIQRMQDNVRQNQCQVCTVPITKDQASYVINCCQLVVCSFCVIINNGHSRQYIRRCPNCTITIKPRKHLIYVGAGLELESALTDDVLLAGPDENDLEADKIERSGNNYAAWSHNPRLRALLQLIQDDPIEKVSDELTSPIVHGLLDGRQDVPFPKGKKHKYLIYSMYTESTDQIAEAFKSVKIKYTIIRGSRQEKDQAVSDFKTDKVDVMIATSSRECAGLHIPEVTRLVLYHHHVDGHIAKQVVGRAQRVGRECSLEVIEVVDECEARRIKSV